MKRVLIYNDDLNGHQIEYLHHLYIGASQHKENDYIFAIPEGVNIHESVYNWDSASNIRIHYINSQYLNIKGRKSILTSYKKSKIVYDIAKLYSVSDVMLILFMQYLPMIACLFWNNFKVSGIIYSIYLYRWNESTFSQKIQDVLKFLLLSKSSVFKNIFILNDRSSTIHLNKIYKTKKMKYLPDPFVEIPKFEITDIRTKLNISSETIVFSHLGGMDYRKGTIEILKAIEMLSVQDLYNKCFIFAGKVYDDIKIDFYKILEEQRVRVRIICFDEFCDYSFLGSLCNSSDYILLPYSNTSQSSGIIGYCAQFNVPAVVPNEKLLGKLVRKYKLGYLMEGNSHIEIANFIVNSKKGLYDFKGDKYIKENNVYYFNKVIFDNL